jgi:hypothetical protein
MKSTAVLVSGILGVLLIAVPGGAQREPIKPKTGRYGDPSSIARKYQDYLYGVIKTIDANEMVLTKTKFGIDETFKFDRKTKFIHDGKTSTRERLKPGDEVWVDINKDKKTGEMIAKKVATGVDVVE